MGRSSKTVVLIASIVTVVFNVMTYIMTRAWVILVAAGFLAWFAYICFDFSKEVWRRRFFLFLSISTAVYSVLMFILSLSSSDRLAYYSACVVTYVLLNALFAFYFKKTARSP